MFVCSCLFPVFFFFSADSLAMASAGQLSVGAVRRLRHEGRLGHGGFGVNSAPGKGIKKTKAKWPWFKTVLVPFWDRGTTHFRTYLSGDWDVHWGYGVLPPLQFRKL